MSLNVLMSLNVFMSLNDRNVFLTFKRVFPSY